jgi:hypothetical protein
VTNFGSGNYVVGEGNGGFNPEFVNQPDGFGTLNEKLKIIWDFTLEKLPEFGAKVTQKLLSGKVNDVSFVDAMSDCIIETMDRLAYLSEKSNGNSGLTTQEEDEMNKLKISQGYLKIVNKKLTKVCAELDIHV